MAPAHHRGRQGVGTALVRAGVEAAKVLHALHHPTLRLVVDVHKAEHISGVPELVRAHGFTPVRYYQFMQHPLGTATPTAAVPAGMRFEPWSEHDDEDFRSVRNESYRDHWGSAPMPPDLWRNKITNQTFQRENSFLLRDAATGTRSAYW